MEQNDTRNLIDRINDILTDEHGQGITESECLDLASHVPDDNALAELLPAIKEIVTCYKNNTDDCDKHMKELNDSKKMWKARTEQVITFVGFVLNKLGHKSYTAGNTKASIITRPVLEVTDEDGLLDQYRNLEEFAQLRSMLPGWVKMTLSIDKTALNSYVKVDNSLLCDHPEWLHTKNNTSVNLK